MGAGAHGGGGGEGVSEHPEKKGLTDHLVAPTLPSSQPVALLTMQHEAGPRGGHTCPSYTPLHVQRGLTCALGPAQSWVLGTQKGWRSPKCGTCNKEEPIRALRAPPSPGWVSRNKWKPAPQTHKGHARQRAEHKGQGTGTCKYVRPLSWVFSAGCP